MSKFKIVLQHQKNDKPIIGNVEFKNLEKLDYMDLDIVIKMLYGTIMNKKNKINLEYLAIYYVHECGQEELKLYINDLNVLQFIFLGVDYLFHEGNTIDKKTNNKHRKAYYKDIEKRLKKHGLNKYPIEVELVETDTIDE